MARSAGSHRTSPTGKAGHSDGRAGRRSGHPSCASWAVAKAAWRPLRRSLPSVAFAPAVMHNRLCIDRNHRARCPSKVEQGALDTMTTAVESLPARIREARTAVKMTAADLAAQLDRKSTRLNSSHLGISYAVFCL